jgi:hypothetical protein
MADARRGTPREGAPLQNSRPTGRSDSTFEIATSTTARRRGERAGRFTLRLEGRGGTADIRSLRAS